MRSSSPARIVGGRVASACSTRRAQHTSTGGLWRSLAADADLDDAATAGAASGAACGGDEWAAAAALTDTACGEPLVAASAVNIDGNALDDELTECAANDSSRALRGGTLLIKPNLCSDHTNKRLSMRNCILKQRKRHSLFQDCGNVGKSAGNLPVQSLELKLLRHGKRMFKKKGACVRNAPIERDLKSTNSRTLSSTMTVFAFVLLVAACVALSSATPLDDYVHAPDPAFNWTVVNSFRCALRFCCVARALLFVNTCCHSLFHLTTGFAHASVCRAWLLGVVLVFVVLLAALLQLGACFNAL